MVGGQRHQVMTVIHASGATNRFCFTSRVAARGPHRPVGQEKLLPDLLVGPSSPTRMASTCALASSRRLRTAGADGRACPHEPATSAAWRSIPSWDVIGTHDAAISPAAQLRMAHRAHAHITQIPAWHASMLSSQALSQRSSWTPHTEPQREPTMRCPRLPGGVLVHGRPRAFGFRPGRHMGRVAGQLQQFAAPRRQLLGRPSIGAGPPRK